MKQNSHRSSGGKLRALFCLGLSAVLAAGVALNTTAASTKPVQYDISVHSSPTHTAALSEGSLYFWGTNDNGQFPNSTLTYSDKPVMLAEGLVDAAVSKDRTLTVSKNGQLKSYGVEPATGNVSGSAGTTVAKNAVQVEAQENFAAYIDKNGAVYTWGKNEFSRLGTGSDESSATPVKIISSGVTKVALGKSFGLALTSNGEVYGWGDVAYLLATDEEYNSGNEILPLSAPTKLAENMQDITAGNYHGCMLTKNGTLYSFGDNTYDQAGSTDTYSNRKNKLLTGIRSVTSGAYHNFAIANDGSVYAWGYGLSGQLGNGSTACYSTPTLTSFEFVQIFACDENTFGITEDGDLYSFGNNTNYRLGKSNGSDSLSPERILDREMNWVYSDTPANEHPSHGAEGSGTTQLPVDTAPETASTPFVSGYPDGTFRPSNSVTRAEFLKMLVSALCEDFDPAKDYGTCSYSDIPLGKWYENYIAYAEQKNLIKGYSDGTFRPENYITRAEAASLTATFLSVDLENAPPTGFTDILGTSSNWAAPAINSLVKLDVIHGYSDGTFRPKENIRRSDAATLIAQAAGFRPNDEEKAEFVKNFPTSPFSDVSSADWYYVYMLRAVGSVTLETPETAQ